MSVPVLELSNVSKYFSYGIFGTIRFPAVDGVSLSVGGRPQIITIAGESGCGKSTLAKLALGFLKPDRGNVYYKGKDIWKIGHKEKRLFMKEVQPIFQDPYDAFNPVEPVENYLKKTAKTFYGNAEGKEIGSIIDLVLSYVGLSYDEIKGKKLSELSGGQLQRASIARALLAQPRIIIADEPVSMIDASLRINILNLFRNIKEERGISILYITHDLATAFYISNLIAIMFRGTIVEIGSAKDLMEKPGHPYTKVLMESVPDYRKRGAWLSEEVEAKALEIKEFRLIGCKYVDRCPFAMDICRTRRPPPIETSKEHYVACWLYEKK